MSSPLKVAILALTIAGAGVCWWILSRETRPETGTEGDYLGSAACRDCHEGFYEKWATSWHGLAMRPYTPEFARAELTPQPEPIEIRGRKYQAELKKGGGLVRESRPDREESYPIEHVLGGKNLFYFLTPFRGGRLQVLPLAYDTQEKEWYDSAASMVRHFQEQSDEALDWTERPLTFNTSCYGCHVSQLSRNYSFESDSYATTWSEPGINCESCHGPGRKHVEVCLKAKGKIPENLEIILTRNFTPEQTNSMCAHCHAKMTPLTETFVAGERFFDHFNLVALEDRDLYPDGRELGENYTWGPFLIGPCASSGKLDCMHCHTSSGRNKHTGADADRACMPCHEKHVKDPGGHSFHPVESEASRCVSCHMPMTVFARMRRHDHSLLPPSPSATIEFGSPNACNLCHADQEPKWADDWVRKWYPRDYQAPILERARLIQMARKRDWSRIKEMTDYIGRKDRNIMYAAGLLRLLEQCPDPAKWAAYFRALGDPSPLVRACAAAGLRDCPLPEALPLLAVAAGDDFRVVRVQAAGSLARRPVETLPEGLGEQVDEAFREHVAFLRCRQDDPLSHYNLGNFHQDRGRLETAATSYESALKLEPRLVPAHVNLSLVHARLGEPVRAESSLRAALRHDPDNAEANFNLALLLAEHGRNAEAETCLRLALKTDPRFAEAAYNLGVLLADTVPEECIELCRTAAALRPDNPRYAYTLAFYLYRQKSSLEAADALRKLLQEYPEEADAIALLGTIYEETGRATDAIELYRGALALGSLPPPTERDFAQRLAALEDR